MNITTRTKEHNRVPVGNERPFALYSHTSTGDLQQCPSLVLSALVISKTPTYTVSQ